MTTKLKSAEEWLKEYDQDQRDHIISGVSRKLKHSTGDYVRAIQLNALESAVELFNHGTAVDVRKSLLTQIEELKKK